MKVKVISVSSAPCPYGSGACLSHDDLDFWFEAVVGDEVEAVEKHLSTMTKQGKKELLNGHFCANIGDLFTDLRGLNLTGRKALTYRTLVMVAVGWGAEKILELCLREGVDLLVTDRGGDNAVHALVKAATLALVWEDGYISLFKLIRNKLPLDQLRQLLLQENDNGYRPLELAAHGGSFGMFQEIFRTEGVYMNRVNKAGGFQIEHFDITEYERYQRADNRHMKSPLWHLSFLDASLLAAPRTKEVFTSPPMRVWCSLKIRAAIPLIVAWAAIRLVTFTAIMIWVFAGGMLEAREKANIQRLLSGNLSANQTHCVEKLYAAHPWMLGSDLFINILRFFMLFVVAQILILDLVEFLVWTTNGWKRRFMRTIHNRHKKLVSMEFEFRSMQFVMAISMGLMGLFHYLGNESATHILFVIVMICTTGTMCSFVQLLPIVGPIVIKISSLFFEMLGFILILGLFLLPISIFINVLLVQTYVGPCDLSFIDVSVFYRSFMIMLNMVNFRSMPLSEYESIYVMHFVFIFMISILLLNFLIASFSNTINKLVENEETVVTIQRLSMALRCEYRVGAIFPGLVDWLHKKSFEYCEDTDTFWVNSVRPRNLQRFIQRVTRQGKQKAS